MKTFLGTIAGLALCHGGLAQSLPIVNLGYVGAGLDEHQPNLTLY